MPEVLNIPIVTGGKAFRETLDLDGEEYALDFSFNQRDVWDATPTGAWYLTIFKNNERISPRLRIVAGYELLEAVISIDKPPGKLYLYDIDLKTTQGQEADRDNFGDRIILVYEPAGS